jgi:sugar phosphate isomerase/epimerase
VLQFGDEVAAAGMRVSGLNLNRGILTRTHLADQHRAEAERAIRIASLLGAEVVNLSLSMPTLPTADHPALKGCDVPDEEHARAAEIVRELGSLAAQANVKIALDLHDDGLLDTPDLCLRLLDRVALGNVGINPDLGNICRGPGPLPDWRRALQLLAAHAHNWHVKNYRNQQPVPLWEGEIDYREVMGVMQAVGYRGWVSIESYVGDVFESQRLGLRHLQLLAEAVSHV